MKFYRKYNSPIGVLTFGSDGESLTGLWIEGQDYFPEISEDVTETDDLPVFKQAEKWLDSYFQGKDPGEIPRVAPEGTEFRKVVWDVLKEIPYGDLTTYGELANEISRRQNGKFISPRAVGGAVGHNPVSILIPCHRVIGSDGNLTGYAGGLDRKIQLLELEGLDTSNL